MTWSIDAIGAAAHSANAAVTPVNPAHSAGKTLYAFGLIRSGVATLATPAGWTLVASLISTTAPARIYVWAKKAASSAESNPTITPSGGAGAESVTAFVITTDGGAELADVLLTTAPRQNTTSSQDPPYAAMPVNQANCLILAIAGYADNIGAAVFSGPSSFTTSPVAIAQTTLGADQTLAVFAAIQTIATNIDAGTFDVSGGAGAQSATLLVALKPASAPPSATTVTSTDSDDSVTSTQTGVIVQCANLQASGAGSKVEIIWGSITVGQTVNSWNSGTGQININVVQGNLPFFTSGGKVRVTNNDGSFAERALTMLVPSTAHAAVDLDFSATGIAALTFDSEGAPNRRYWETSQPLGDIPATVIQEHHEVLQTWDGSALLATKVHVNPNLSMEVDPVVRLERWRIHDGTRWIGTSISPSSYATWEWGGAGPTYIGPDTGTVDLVQNVAMPSINFGPRFIDSDSGSLTYSLKQLGSTTNIMQANGAGTNAAQLIVDDAAPGAVGDWVTIGGGQPVQLMGLSGSTWVLSAQRSWLDNATVARYAVNNASIPGVTLTGAVLGGTPTTLASHAFVFVRGVDETGTFADSTPTTVGVSSPPIPPQITGQLSGEVYVLGSGVHTLDFGVLVTGATSFSIAPSVPVSVTFNTTNGRLTVQDIVLDTYTFVVTAHNAAGPSSFDEVRVGVVAPPPPAVEFTGLMAGQPAVLTGLLLAVPKPVVKPVPQVQNSEVSWDQLIRQAEGPRDFLSRKKDVSYEFGGGRGKPRRFFSE